MVRDHRLLELTARQAEVARLLARSEIAAALRISAHTVHQHERVIFDKLGCNRRAKVAVLLHDTQYALVR